MGKTAVNLNPRRINSYSIYAIQPTKQARFNEDYDEICSNMKLSTVSVGNLHKLNKQNDARQGNGPRSVFSSHASKGSRIKSALGGSRKSVPNSNYVSRSSIVESHKKRIIEAVNNLNEEELEKVSEMLKVAESLDAEEDKGENEVDEVTAPEELEGEQDQAADGEEKDDVASLDNITVQTPLQDKPEDAYSSVSKANPSQASISKSVVSSL